MQKYQNFNGEITTVAASSTLLRLLLQIDLSRITLQ